MRLINYNHPWGVLDDILDLHQDVNRLFDSRRTLSGAELFPPMNAWVSPEKIIVRAEVPGLTEKDLTVTVERNVLTLTGRREPEKIDDQTLVHRQECHQGEFKRVLELPYAIQVDQVKAVCQHGLLTLILPRAESEKPRKIAIEPAA